MSEKTVTLPTRKVVRVSDTPQEWWSQDEGSGYLDPRLAAPDPDQPRKHMNTADFQELKTSVRERGVRQSLILTPRTSAPWVQLPPENDHLPFVVVSGHRRRKSAIEAEVFAVPITIRIYETEEDHRIDAFILNKDHSDLTPIEEGWEIVRLQNKGVSLFKIAKASGMSVGYVENRRNLTQLHPAIQELIDPSLPSKKQLSLTIAGELGGAPAPTRESIEQMHITFDDEIKTVKKPALMPSKDIWNFGPDLLRFELQKILLAVITDRSLGAIRAKEFIHGRVQDLKVSGKKSGAIDRFQPRKRKLILMNLTETVLSNMVVDWTPSEYEKMFESSNSEEVDTYRVAINRAVSMMSDLATLLQRIKERKLQGGSKVVTLAARR